MATSVTAQDLHLGDDLAHAVNAGMSEATVEAQHVKAISILQAKSANSVGESNAITAAIALLNANLSHLRDPKNH